jgi:hypothetical protein
MQTTSSTGDQGDTKARRACRDRCAPKVEASFLHESDLASEARLLDRFLGNKIADLFKQTVDR